MSTDIEPQATRVGMRAHVAETRQTRHVFWVRYIRLGMLISLLTAAAFFVYLALAPQGRHEQGLRAVAVLTVFSVVLLSGVPVQRVARSRWRWWFFYGWSFACVALAGVAAALDGGSTSPLATALFLPLLYAAMAYPPGGVVAVAVTTLGTFAVVSVTDSDAAQPAQAVLVGMVLGLSSLMAIVGARHRALQERALARIRRQLAEEATADPLTGCANRRAFLDVLASESARATRHRRPLALLAVDIDRFKQVNDAYGHPAGDGVLVALADVLRRHTRAGDVVARLGGDEFSIVLPECGRADAERLAQRLRTAVVEAVGVPPVRISVGLAVADGRQPVHGESLITEADRALYAAKRAQPFIATNVPDLPDAPGLPAAAG